MSKKILWRLSAIMMVAMLSVGFASCGDDDDDGPGGAGPKTTTTDGLEGYWMEDDTTPLFYYLDGEGGGTFYYSGAGTNDTRFNTRYQSSPEYRYPFTKLYFTVKDNTGKTYTLYGEQLYSEAFIYTRTGSTMLIVAGNKTTTFNVINGAISGYKKVTIVN